MWEIFKNIVFVEGAVNAAIYNLNTGEVYSVNSEGKRIIKKVIENDKVTLREHDYLKILEKNGLLDFSIQTKIKPYIALKKKNNLKLVWLEITQACNMHCLHCYEGQRHIASGNTLTLEQWKKVIDQIIELGVKRVVVIGGEPCIHKNIVEILQYLRLKKETLSITLFTNGYFFDERLFEVVIENRIDVKLSLYGHTAEIHDSITGVKGSFSRLKNTVFRLTDNGVNVNVAITLMKENEKYYEDIKSFVKKLPVKVYKFDVIREVVNGTQNAHVPMTKKVVEMAYRNKPNFYAPKGQFDNNIYYNSCWNGKMVITETGDILPCVFARNHVCGNINDVSLNEVIYGETQLKKCWENTYDTVDECNVCEYRYACHDCRPIAESAKDLYTKNPRCKYNPFKGEWINE